MPKITKVNHALLLKVIQAKIDRTNKRQATIAANKLIHSDLVRIMQAKYGKG
jgi:hypothetical protein